MLVKFFDFLVDTLVILFMPSVHMYYTMTGDLFLNASDENATGLEGVANTFLIPYQFVFSGQVAAENENGEWTFQPRFPVDTIFWPKMALNTIALPVSLTVGGSLKALSMLDPAVRDKYGAMKHANAAPREYQEMGIPSEESPEFFSPMNLPRKPGQEHHMQLEKECLAAIAHHLNESNIVWWLDCGSCLGAYRYGGVIPWDDDIDIAVLLPDFDRVLSALKRLDPKKYIVEDWSSRDIPKSLIKVFVRKTGACIDVYHFAIDSNKKEVQFVLSLEKHTFMPEWWKIRERRFKVPTPFDEVFPLKVASFDGVEVFLPSNPEKYLQRRYGENLAPAKVYNPITDNYEKDLSHPYWNREFAH